MPRGSSAGFTLLETLTALTVLSIALVSLFEAHAQGLTTAGSAASYARARIFAQGLLVDATSGWGGELASKRGTEGAFTWSIDVELERSSWADVKTEGNWRLNRVRVTVAWDRGRQINLETVKLARTK
jgi:prepilin-type N-terminal cleavage/methylation domain-containing protein